MTFIQHLNTLAANNNNDNYLHQKVLGCMTGTSLDGVDLCLVSFKGSTNFTPEKNLSEIMEIEKFVTLPYPKNLLDLLHELLSVNSNIINQDENQKERLLPLICKANTLWSQEIGKLTNQEFPPEKFDFKVIASHGQTLWHTSKDSTLQIGDTEILAQVTNKTVVGNFRAADVALGGTGAPLVPFIDRFLAKEIYSKMFPQQENSATGKLILLQNLGGIGNVSIIHSSQSSRTEILCAFDTGPANVILNELVLRIFTPGLEEIKSKLQEKNKETELPNFDKDGFYSSRGSVIPSILEFIVAHPFLQKMNDFLIDEHDDTDDEKASPIEAIEDLRKELKAVSANRSTGREDFGASFVGSVFFPYLFRFNNNNQNDDDVDQAQIFFDLCATAVEFTAICIALHLRVASKILDRFSHRQKFTTHDVVMSCSGGGSLHPLMMQRIAETNKDFMSRVVELSEVVQFKTTAGEDFGNAIDGAKEAECFALLGHEKLCSLVVPMKNGEILGTNEPTATGSSKKCFLGQISCPW